MKRVRRPRRPMSILKWVLVITLTADAAVVGLVAGLYATVAPLVPDETQLERYRPQETTRIFSRDGQLLAAVFEENRKVVPIAQMPRWLVQATIAIEDERFEEHPGVDPRGIARAVRVMIGGGHQQGGSTITQQLARDIYLSRDRTVTRKLQEMTLALRIERRFSKQEILNLYMNQICYGHRAYGVNAAAETLFGKPLDKLTLGECALIAGLARNPQGYSPIDHPTRAATRRNVVLAKMLELGFITRKQYDEAKSEPIRTRPPQNAPWKLKQYRAPWFTTYVLQQLVDKYGYEKVYSGGLQVYTTVDLKLQEYAQDVLREGLGELRRVRANRGAIVCMDPRSGEILAMVGGADFTKSEYNSAWQAHRQPGSSFKPIMYTAAMERIGLTPGDVYNASPATFRGYWGVYTPQNFTEKQQGPMSVATAVAQSCNVVAVRVIIRTGPRRVIEQAQKMGFDPQGKYLQPYPALALGAGEVTPLEMTVGYSAFANGGHRVDPLYVTHITDSAGGLIYRSSPRLVRVMSPRTAVYMNQVLRGVVTSGTGRGAQISSPAGGKTGTTQEAKDVWFMGFTPGFCAAVWIGNDANQRMYGATGGGFCAPLWKKVALFARSRARELGRPWPEKFP
ncbi:MAG: PBP1A family penicillin-binding protein, partial [Armatimonadetes bacterium]|nr:PBP1A family penicillin-binding protein [Armatimonadota bacterium]